MTDPYNDSYDNTGGCECEYNEEQPCDLYGEPGIQLCEHSNRPDTCTYWSRCQRPCRTDRDCGEGQECGNRGVCVPLPTIPVCDRQPLMLSELALHDRASSLELADVDGDGALDLIAVLEEVAAVEVALGDGAGGFAPGILYPTGLDVGNQTFAVADFDGDGSPDIAVAESWDTSKLSVLLGQAGVFDPPVVTTVPSRPGRLAAGDFDGDAYADLLAFGDWPDLKLALYRGNAGGQLTPEFHEVPGGSPVYGGAGAVAGEARLDLLVPHSAGPGAAVLEYTPGLGFSPIAALAGDGVTPHNQVAVGDIDGDAAPDVVAARSPPGSQQIQTWSQLLPASSFWSPWIWITAVTDVDGDGRDDLVARGSNGVSIVYVDGPCVQSHDLHIFEFNLAAGDLDGDGQADIVTGNDKTVVKILRTGP